MAVHGRVQVLYVKDSVWVWPNKRSRIMGRLALTLQRGVLFLSWLPYSPGTINPVRRHPRSHARVCLLHVFRGGVPRFAFHPTLRHGARKSRHCDANTIATVNPRAARGVA